MIRTLLLYATMYEAFLSFVNAVGTEFEQVLSVTNTSAMAASFEIGNGCQSPRSSFTFDLSQIDTNDDRQSPRISFCINLPQTDRISPEKRKREEVANVNCEADFEFCVISNNNIVRNSIIRETMLPDAEKLFVDGQVRPLIHVPVEAQPITIASHLRLESSSCRSTVRPTSSPPSKITSSCSGNVSSKSSTHNKPPNKWKEIMFKLSSQERKSSKKVDQDRNLKQNTSSTKSLWPFSRSCSTGGERRGNGLFCSLPFSRSQSAAEHKYKPETSGCLVEGSKPLETWSISNQVQSAPRCLGELKPRFEPEDGKEKTKVKQTSGRSNLGSRRATGIVDENGRLMVRNLERSSTSVGKATCLDSPRPGRPMAKGSFPLKDNSILGRGGGVKVSPVLNVNVPTCISIGYVGGRWNGGGGLFGFSPKREKKQASAYHHHYSRTPTNRKKGT